MAADKTRPSTPKGGLVLMSLSDDLKAEAATTRWSQRSQIDAFLETLNKQDRNAIDEWLAAGKSSRALYRVLKRRGLPVADSTFRNWVTNRDAS